MRDSRLRRFLSVAVDARRHYSIHVVAIPGPLLELQLNAILRVFDSWLIHQTFMVE
jgi:hypothetical protein